MFLIVGLGNPGKEYDKTNHNIGFLSVQKIAHELGISISKKECLSLLGEGKIGKEKVVLALPQTFMNASGQAVASLCKKYDVKNMIIIQDDIDLSLGMIRIRNHGSAGTHNGMKSVIEHSPIQDFIRIRIGAGPVPENVPLTDYVLSRIPKSSAIWDAIDTAKDACIEIVKTGGWESACQKYSK